MNLRFRGIYLSKFILKLIALNLFLATFPVGVLGVFSYYKASSVIQDKVYESNRQVLDQTQLRMEQNLRLIDNSLTQYIQSPFILSVMKETLLPEQFEMINELSSSLYKLLPFDMGIYNVTLINYDKKWLVNNSGFYRLEDYASSNEVWSGYMAQPKLSMWTTYGPMIRLVKRLPIHSATPSGLLVADIPVYPFHERLSAHGSMGKTYILDADFKLLAHPDLTSTEPVLPSLSWVDKARDSGSASGMLTIQSDGTEMGITYKVSSYNQWIYVSEVALEQLMQDTRSIGWLTAAICLIVSLFSLAVSMQGMYRFIFAPLRLLYNSVVRSIGKDAGEPGDNELELIGERFSSLWTKQREMADQMMAQHKQLGQYYISRLLQEEVREKEIKEQLKDYPRVMVWKQHAILVVQMDSLAGTRYKESDRDLLLYAIHNIVSELIEPERCLPPVILGKWQATLLGWEEDDRSELKAYSYNLAEKIRDTMWKIIGLSVSIGISASFPRLSEASAVFRETGESLAYSVKMGRSGAILQQDDAQAQAEALRFPAQSLSELAEAVRLTDEPGARELLGRYIQEIYRLRLGRHDYHMAMMRLVIELTKELQNAGESVQALLKRERPLMTEVMELSSAEEAELWIAEYILKPTIRILEKRRDNRISLISDQMIRLIEQEYDQDITLERCASCLSYHPAHLKKVFRRETGMNFSDYVTRYRMNIAKEWLRTTDMRISDIAEKLQYHNPQNFIRAFRKLEGITPGQYREQQGI